MPWKAQICPFCHNKYANKKGLTDHLLKYTGTWRLPADGVHDVLRIKGLSLMRTYFSEERTTASYRCPTCSGVIKYRRKFLEHVVFNHHYNNIQGGISWGSQPSFDPEPYKVWQPKGRFPFLHLPLELREMVYKAALCFEKIEICTLRKPFIDPVRGVYLQHNPPKNLLALMAVSRQVYHEARRVFYRWNTFTFSCKEALPIFLIAIGKENALLLESVEWDCGSDSSSQEYHTDIIKSHLAQNEPQSKETADIWNDEDQFMALLEDIMFPESVYRGNTYRPLRLDAGDLLLPTDYYERYLLTIYCYEDAKKKRKCEAGYEVRTRRVEDTSDRERILQALMDEKNVRNWV